MNIREYEKDEMFRKLFGVRLFGASIICRVSRDYEYDGWTREAILSGAPHFPDGECEKGENCEGTRNPCDHCIQVENWANQILNCVAKYTNWGLYRYDNGPGRRFAHEPFVSQKGSRIKVSWSGGLDI